MVRARPEQSGAGGAPPQGAITALPSSQLRSLLQFSTHTGILVQLQAGWKLTPAHGNKQPNPTHTQLPHGCHRCRSPQAPHPTCTCQTPPSTRDTHTGGKKCRPDHLLRPLGSHLSKSGGDAGCGGAAKAKRRRPPPCHPCMCRRCMEVKYDFWARGQAGAKACTEGCGKPRRAVGDGREAERAHERQKTGALWAKPLSTPTITPSHAPKKQSSSTGKEQYSSQMTASRRRRRLIHHTL